MWETWTTAPGRVSLSLLSSAARGDRGDYRMPLTAPLRPGSRSSLRPEAQTTQEKPQGLRAKGPSLYPSGLVPHLGTITGHARPSFCHTWQFIYRHRSLSVPLPCVPTALRTSTQRWPRFLVLTCLCSRFLVRLWTPEGLACPSWSPQHSVPVLLQSVTNVHQVNKRLPVKVFRQTSVETLTTHFSGALGAQT